MLRETPYWCDDVEARQKYDTRYLIARRSAFILNLNLGLCIYRSCRRDLSFETRSQISYHAFGSYSYFHQYCRL